MRTASLLGLAVSLALFAGAATTQEPGKGPPVKPVDVFKQFRGLVNEGRYDLASGYLKAFLDTNPDEKDYLEIERLYGPLTFQALRNIPKWSDDATADKKARENVDTLVAKSRGYTEKFLRDPARIAKYVRNLGATYEERVFAEQELKRTGDFAIPYLVDAYRGNPTPEHAAGILGSILKADSPSVAAWVAALDGLNAEQQFGVLSTISNRPDSLNLLTAAQTDFRGWLWRIANKPENASFARFAAGVLSKIYAGGVQNSPPEVELVALARPFYERRARFDSARTNPDGSTATVPLWTWDDKANKLVKIDEVPVGTAEEYFGLRYARWALEQAPDPEIAALEKQLAGKAADDAKPDRDRLAALKAERAKKPYHEPAQRLIIALATERAVERGKFGDVARTSPAVYQLLSDAPSSLLTDLYDQALSQKRTAQVLAYTQALGDRADKDAAGQRAGNKPSLFVRALNYPDPRVQLAAASAILRSPSLIEPGVRARIVDVLRRAAGADGGGPKGSALIADPNRMRADSTSSILRGLGYDVEQFATGRDLLRRVAKASDFDLILIDHHTPNPELTDLVSHLRSDLNTVRRPILVVASGKTIPAPSFEQLLLRFGVLIAATDTDFITMPPPFVPDVRRPIEEVELNRRENLKTRDERFLDFADGKADRFTGVRDSGRIQRLLRVVKSSGVVLSPQQEAMLKLRTEQITFAVLDAEYTLSAESSPLTFARVQELNRRIILQPQVKDEIQRVGQDSLMRLIERFELDVSRNPAAQARYDMLRSKVDAASLGLKVVSPRDYEAEAKASRLVRSYPGVAVIPEPFSRIGFEDDLRAAFQDPADAPRDPSEKAAGARVAVEWLRKMAIGELTGFDIKPAAGELIAALGSNDLAVPAIDAVGRSPSAAAQEALVAVAVNAGRPVPIRVKAADAAVRHIQSHGRLTTGGLIAGVVEQSKTEQNGDVRSKLFTLKGLLAYSSDVFITDLKNFNPPVVPPPPPMPPMPPTDPKKDGGS